MAESELLGAYARDVQRGCEALRRELLLGLPSPEDGLRSRLEMTLHGIKGVAAALAVGESAALCHALEALLRGDAGARPFATILPALLQGIAELEAQGQAAQAGLAPPPVSALMLSLLTLAVDGAASEPDRPAWPSALVQPQATDDFEALFAEHSKVPAPVVAAPEAGLGSLEPYLAAQLPPLASRLGKQATLHCALPALALPEAQLSLLRTQIGHLLRNALDHGVEAPVEREALGKAPEGKLTLIARQEDGALELSFADDGAGIDEGALRQRHDAARAGEPLLDLLCAPGLSSRREITHVSGRGVGLAAVRAAIEEAGGVLSVQTTRGQGTCFTLSLPLGTA